MKLKALLMPAAAVLVIAFSSKGLAQVPQANFSISPSPACAGSPVHITDLSTNSPTSWSYTLHVGPAGSATSSVQNPNITYNNPGTQTITLIASNASGASAPVSLTFQVLPSPMAALNLQTANTCIGGNPIALSVTTGTANTIAWNTGLTTSSISVSPTLTSVYTVTVSNAAGCSVVRTATVTVGPPAVTIAGNPAAICGGGSVTLGATSPGQGPGTFTYSWSNSVTTRTISTNIPGVYSVSVTGANGCTGTQSYTLGTTSSLTVTAQATQTSICSGNNANLFATGASSYSWSTGATNPQIMVTPATTTTYTVTGASGTCTASATAVIVVTPGPTVVVTSIPGNTLCTGATATLTASGANNFFWSTGGAAAGASVIVTPTASITYTVIGLNQGCTPRPATIALVVSNGPTLSLQLNSDTICDGQEAVIAASGASSYSWNTGATSPIVTISPSVTTLYSVTGANAAGCSAMASITQNVVECTGIKAFNASSTPLQVYPNPSSNSFVISAPGNISLNIVNDIGQLVKTVILNDSNEHKATVTGLSSGIYFISGQNISVTQKIIVTR